MRKLKHREMLSDLPKGSQGQSVQESDLTPEHFSIGGCVLPTSARKPLCSARQREVVSASCRHCYAWTPLTLTASHTAMATESASADTGDGTAAQCRARGLICHRSSYFLCCAMIAHLRESYQSSAEFMYTFTQFPRMLTTYSNVIIKIRKLTPVQSMT